MPVIVVDFFGLSVKTVYQRWISWYGHLFSNDALSAFRVQTK
jgi:hypothetical protein